MIFKGVSKDFSTSNNQQYVTIGEFWDEMAGLYGLENLQGLGYKWSGNTISYAIGLKNGDIDGCNFSIRLPDSGWSVVEGKTECLQAVYEEIYRFGKLKYEIETFSNDGTCKIRYCR